MLGSYFQPFTSMQELNLDWILNKIKNILRFVPDDGAVGQILRRTAHGAEWSDEQGGSGAVTSVNGQTGAVMLDASDVGALPDTYTAPVTSVNGQTGAVALDASDVGALPDTYTAPVTSVNGQTGDVVIQTAGLVIDDVWVNPNGTGTSFPATTLSLDLSAYDYYMVYCAYNTATPRLSGGQWFPVDDGEYQITADRLNNNYNSSRSFQYNTLLKQLSISVGVYNGSNDAGSMIPYFIKGVKL